MTVVKYSNIASGKVTEEKVAELDQGLDSFAVANFADQHCILTGGANIHDFVFAKAYELDVMLSKWDTDSLPDMNEARVAHASVCIGSKVYVFAGMGNGNSLSTTMECLDLSSRLGYGFG